MGHKASQPVTHTLFGPLNQKFQLKKEEEIYHKRINFLSVFSGQLAMLAIV
jgi:hypothetical protein